MIVLAWAMESKAQAKMFAFAKVDQQLYRSSMPRYDENFFKFIKDMKIARIIDLTMEKENKSSVAKARAEQNGIEYMKVPINFFNPTLAQKGQFEKMLMDHVEMQSVGEAPVTLVHCSAGRDRTGLFVKKYLELKYGVPAIEADKYDQLMISWINNDNTYGAYQLPLEPVCDQYQNQKICHLMKPIDFNTAHALEYYRLNTLKPMTKVAVSLGRKR